MNNKDNLLFLLQINSIVALSGLACVVGGFVELIWPGLIWLISLIWDCLVFWFSIEASSWWVAMNTIIIGCIIIPTCFFIESKLNPKYEEALAKFKPTSKIWQGSSARQISIRNKRKWGR